MAIVEYPDITISTAASWPDDATGWTVRPTLRLANAVKCVSPEMPHAVVTQLFGITNESDRTALAAETALDLTDHYIKIEVNSARWVGIVTGHTDGRYAGDGGTPAGTRSFQAFGLEQILANQPLPGSLVYQGGLSYEIARILPFNRTHPRGGNVFAGNRAAAKQGDLWHFVEAGQPWTAKNILEYLFDYFVTGPWGALGGQIDDLDQIVPGEFDPTGMTVYQILNALVSHKRGYCWSVRYGGQVAVPQLYPYVYIHGISGSTIESGDFLFYPNPEVGSVALSDNILQDWQPEASARDLKDSVEVRGAPIRMVCSLGQNVPDHDEEAVPVIGDDWTEAEETEVLEGASNEADYDLLTVSEKVAVNDLVRAEERLSHVFSRFGLDADGWTDLLDAAGMTMALDESFDATGEPESGTTQWFHWGRPFERVLAMKEGVDYSAAGWQAAETDELEARRPFALVYGSDAKWHYVHDLQIYGQSNGRVTMEDRGGALRIQFSPPYRFADETEWAAAEVGGHAPAFGATRTFVATVTFDLDEPLRVTKRLSANDHADFRRRIVIRVPSAQLIVAHKHTAVGVSAAGALQWLHLTAEMDDVILDGDTPVGVKLRDDADQLRAIALLAADYYGAVRQSMRLRCLGLDDYAKPGKYITNVTADGQTIAVNAVVTRQEWNARGETILQTKWFDVDWAELGASMARARNASVETRLADLQRMAEETE